MPKYNHQKIEKKWWKKWAKEKLYEAKDFSPKPKFYGLVEFPYPSGEGLHAGHVRSYTAMDIVARKKRMDGFNVLYPIGGIEGNEDVAETARREILEETGYKNLTFVRTSEMDINTFFYHRVKQQNRWAHFQFVFFDLEDEEKDPIADHEANLHEIVWKKENELAAFFTVFEGEFLVKLLKGGDFAFVDDGIMANSGQFDGLDSEKVKKEITKFVGGETKVNYHLRDWIFSRQHYWGEPIPLVYCENCKKEAEILKDDSRVVGVGALIEIADNVFIFQRRDKETNRYPDMTAPFGGGLNKGEDFISALKREIKEELNISLNEAEIKEIGNFKSYFEQGRLIKMFYVKIGDSRKIVLREGERIVKTVLEKVLNDKKTTDFTKEVIRYFQDNYSQGATLNPHCPGQDRGSFLFYLAKIFKKE